MEKDTSQAKKIQDIHQKIHAESERDQAETKPRMANMEGYLNKE